MEIKKSKINIMTLNNRGYTCILINHKQGEYAERFLKNLGATDEQYNKIFRAYIKESDSGELEKVFLVMKENFNSHTLTYSVVL